MFRITKTKVRVVYWGGFLAFMILVGFPLFFFFYLFDEAKVKQSIIDGIDNTNYNVEIYGGVVPKLWHGMSLDISGLLITNKNDKDLVRIRRMSCKLSWLDLIIGKYSVNRIAIDGMDINQNNILTSGVTNLLNLPSKKPSIFNLDQLEIRDIDSVGENNPYKFDDGSLMVNQSGFGAKFSFGIKSANLTYYMLNGVANLDTSNNINFDDLNLHIYNTSTNINVSSTAKYIIDKQQFQLFNVNGNVVTNNYVGDINIAKIWGGFKGLNVDNLALQLGSTSNLFNNKILLNVEHLKTNNYKTFVIDKLHNQYSSNFTNITFNIDSQLESITYTESNVFYSNNCANQLNLQTSNITDDRFNAVLNGLCSYNLNEREYNFKLNGQLNNSPAVLDVLLTNKTQKPYVEVDGKLASLDLSKLKLGSNKASVFTDINKLPFNWLSLVNGKARFTIDKFVLDRIALNNLATKFNLSDNQLDISNFKANVYQGNINGNLKIIKSGESYNIYTSQNLTNLSLKGMLNDYFDINAISGVANINLLVNALGVKSYDDILKKITGDINLTAQNGAFQGVDFNLFINPDSNVLTTNRSTIFNRMKSGFKFKNGISTNGGIEFSSPYVIAIGSGILNFINNTLDYNLNIKSALPKNQQKINLVIIPISINGDILSPKINIQHVQLVEDGKKKPPKSKR